VSRFFLDHVVVGVHDLAQATADWRALGLIATDGGSHPKQGTRNAIVRFRDRSFLELMGVEDREKLGASSSAFLQLLEHHPDGAISWALRTDDIAKARDELAKKGLNVSVLREGLGQRDSGKIARWRTFQVQEPGFPFVLQYAGAATADPADDGLPVQGVTAAIVQAISGAALARRLAEAFDAEIDGGRIRFSGGEALVVDEPREHPGVVGVELLVADEQRAAAYLRSRDVPAVDGWIRDRRLHGLRVRFVVE
jgi:hypothetical protein